MLIRRKKREPNDFIQYQFVFTSKDNDFKCFRFLQRAYNSIPDKEKKRKDNNKKKIKG